MTPSFAAEMHPPRPPALAPPPPPAPPAPEPVDITSSGMTPSFAAQMHGDFMHMFTFEDAQQLLSSLRHPRENAQQYHKEARALLDQIANRDPAFRMLLVWPQDVSPPWPAWKHYVAQHKDARIVIGDGIVRVTVERIEGTRDPNRAWRQRTDFVIYHADGSYARLHPGRIPKSDAAVKYASQ
jgi:hypothetical protein